jgi:hypothetical protein
LKGAIPTICNFLNLGVSGGDDEHNTEDDSDSVVYYSSDYSCVIEIDKMGAKVIRENDSVRSAEMVCIFSVFYVELCVLKHNFNPLCMS